MMNKLFTEEASEVGAIVASVTGFSLSDIQSIFGIVCFGVSIILSIINIIIKVKDAKKDGIITEDEKEEIVEELDELKRKVEENVK